MRKLMRKRVIIPLGIVAALAVAGGAIAYLTTSGSGTGSGDVSATNSTLTLHVTSSPIATLGGTSPVTITADNAGTSAEHVSGVTLSAVPADTTTCPAGSFTAGPVTVTANEVPAGATGFQIATSNVTFNDLTTASQNGCLGTGTIAFTAGSN
jgi:hypothetical protein